MVFECLHAVRGCISLKLMRRVQACEGVCFASFTYHFQVTLASQQAIAAASHSLQALIALRSHAPFYAVYAGVSGLDT